MNFHNLLTIALLQLGVLKYHSATNIHDICANTNLCLKQSSGACFIVCCVLFASIPLPAGSSPNCTSNYCLWCWYLCWQLLLNKQLNWLGIKQSPDILEEAILNTECVLSVSASLLYLLTCHVQIHTHVSSCKCHIQQNILMEKDTNPCTLTDCTSNLRVLQHGNSTDLLNLTCGQALKCGCAWSSYLSNIYPVV